MKHTLFFALYLISFAGLAQRYVPADQGSRVHFVIKNFGINTGGDFNGLQGIILFDTANVAAAKFDVTVAANTVDTDNTTRDRHLRSDEYFDAEKFPAIRLVSTAISKTNKTAEGFYFFTGDLTIRDSTHQVSFPFKAVKQANGYVFTGDFQINRLHYGVGQKSAVLSNEVAISLSVTAKSHE